MILAVLNTLASAGFAYLVWVGANFPDPAPVFAP